MPEKEAITLKSAVKAYLEDLEKNGTKETTISVYERALGLALSHFGEGKKLTAIMVPHVGKYYNCEAVNFHPSGRPKAEPTIKQIKRVFRQCMTFCKEQGWITTILVPKTELEHARSNRKTNHKPKASKTEHAKEISKEVKSTDN